MLNIVGILSSTEQMLNIVGTSLSQMYNTAVDYDSEAVASLGVMHHLTRPTMNKATEIFQSVPTTKTKRKASNHWELSVASQLASA